VNRRITGSYENSSQARHQASQKEALPIESQIQRKGTCKYLDQMLDARIIVPLDESYWISPIVV
jgi:hypothetical protein